MYGFQTGAESSLFRWGQLEIDGDLKGGVYGNYIRGSLDGHGTHFDVDGVATASHTSFVGEIGLTANYRVSRHLSVYGGYQVMWLEGVALAGDYAIAMVNQDTDGDAFGSAFYHGAQAGLQCRW